MANEDPSTEPNWKETAEKLWSLLDDIDTLGDRLKPDRGPYFQEVNRIAAKRHDLLRSNGYTLAPVA